MKVSLTYYPISENVTAFSTTRHGGFGKGNYAEFNVNRFCGDEEEAITGNLELLSREIAIDKSRIVMPHQTHGDKVMVIGDDFFRLSEQTRSMVLEGVDALVTNVEDVCIGVSTADCIPVLIYDKAQRAAAAVHAGWRGTVKGIAAKAVRSMQMAYSSRPEDLYAVIGPGISSDAFEVGDEVYEEFASAGMPMDRISERKDKWHIDLPECNRLQLQDVGLKHDNITMSGICTYKNCNDYFSARRLGVESGRIFNGITINKG